MCPITQVVSGPSAFYDSREEIPKEGILRERLRKWGVFEDAAIFAMLKKE
jgi:hypothetical protein